MHRVIALTALAAGVLFAQQPKKPDPAVVERGRSQFKSSCGFCHGDDATGSVPSLYTIDSSGKVWEFAGTAGTRCSRRPRARRSRNDGP